MFPPEYLTCLLHSSAGQFMNIWTPYLHFSGSTVASVLSSVVLGEPLALFPRFALNTEQPGHFENVRTTIWDVYVYVCVCIYMCMYVCCFGKSRRSPSLTIEEAIFFKKKREPVFLTNSDTAQKFLNFAKH